MRSPYQPFHLIQIGDRFKYEGRQYEKTNIATAEDALTGIEEQWATNIVVELIPDEESLPSTPSKPTNHREPRTPRSQMAILSAA